MIRRWMTSSTKALAPLTLAERAKYYKEAIEEVMNEYTGIYYAYECRNWAVSPKVHNAVLPC